MQRTPRDAAQKEEKRLPPKSNHIVQLKDELVKMKKFLNDELPEITKIIPTRDYLKHSLESQPQELSNDRVREIVSINRKLLDEN